MRTQKLFSSFQTAATALCCAASCAAPVHAAPENTNDNRSAPDASCVPPTELNAYAKGEIEARARFDDWKPSASAVVNRQVGISGAINFKDCSNLIYARVEQSNIDTTYGQNYRHFDLTFVDKKGAELTALPFDVPGTAPPESLRYAELTRSMLGIDKPLATVAGGKNMLLGNFGDVSFNAGGIAGVSRSQTGQNGVLASVGANAHVGPASAGLQYFLDRADDRKIISANVDAPWQATANLRLDMGGEVARVTTPIGVPGDANYVNRNIHTLHLNATYRAGSFNFTLSAAAVGQSTPLVPLTTVLKNDATAAYIRQNQLALQNAAQNVWDTNLHNDLANLALAEKPILIALKNAANGDAQSILQPLQDTLTSAGSQFADIVRNDFANNSLVKDFGERMAVELATDYNPSILLPTWQSDLRNRSDRIVEARLSWEPPPSSWAAGWSAWLSLRMDHVNVIANDGGDFYVQKQSVTLNGKTHVVDQQSVYHYDPYRASGWMPGAQVGINYKFGFK